MSRSSPQVLSPASFPVICSVIDSYMSSEKKLTKELLVSNRCGIHARVGGLIAVTAREFTAEAHLRKGSYVADCRSVLDLLSLGAFQGDAVILDVVGKDAEEAMNAIVSLFNDRFNEDELE